ncbi:heme/copper-type cytochrome/quinol oxidase subunit 4 [Lactobacillus colini]|uniref:Heme/copper-type cytochrome/quinol oxidase subunit 4 n=1 Tax=Lactobacillus colini TaxID=1819254 RepID=A0ABS4MEC6_9LACO|nr:zinc ribbon domain-containing protein [Lactobacillus colini]MBP2058044.1 heme/copper-type cytochrome/quinol oxidase subunit 4 [Lactobacillus colini]
MKCPNCDQVINENDEKCPHCGFNLKVSQENSINNGPNPTRQTGTRMSRRAAHEKDLHENSNSTVEAMITWIRVNATIVFLIGVALLILMSFSRPLAWFSFFALMVWLFIICNKNKQPQQYTADARLTEEVNRVSSNVVNSLEQGENKLKVQKKRLDAKRGIQRDSESIEVRPKRTAAQFGVILMAAFNLITVFFGPFASNAMLGYRELSTSKVLLNLGGLGGKYALIGYGLWLVFTLIPIAIIVITIKNKKYNRQIVFTLAIVETIILFICVFELVFLNAGKSIGITNSNVISDAKIQQVLANVVSFGISAYLLFISSILTTIIASKNLNTQK